MPTISDPLPDGAGRQVGDAGDNLLVGTDIDGQLFGLGGSNYLEGNDNLTTGYSDPDSGNDLLPNEFAFDKDDGHDTIADFNPAGIVCLPLPGMPCRATRSFCWAAPRTTSKPWLAVFGNFGRGCPTALRRYGHHHGRIPPNQVSPDLIILG
jgi:hypothetical protein